MSTALPPSYTHAEIPSYTPQPRGDEQTLGLTNRVRRAAHESPLSSWTKRVGHATLTLTGQSSDAQLPVYGRSTVIQGFVTLDSTEDVENVQLKLEGRVKCKTIAEIGQSDTTVLSLVKSLWKRSDASSPCPSKLSFEYPLSTTSTRNGQSSPLPPSFEYTFYDVQGGTPGLKAKIKYEIFVEVEHSHLSLKDRLMASLSTQFIYLPRSRPGRPISDSATSVFDAVMERRVGGKNREVDPIVWKLRLHPPGVYAITQPIPFHVTVTSRSSTLLAPFAPTNKKDPAAIRVYVLRQVSIKVNTIDLWRSYVLAEGSLTYVPHSLEDGIWLKNVASIPKKAASVHSGDSVGSSSEKEGWATHEWSGELKIDRNQANVGGFAFGDMIVKDFIVLSVVPPNPSLGDLLEVKRVVPIQLTTDAWVPEITSYSLPPAPIDNHTESNPDTNGYLEGRGEGYHVESRPQNGTNGHGGYHNGLGMNHA